MKSITPLYVAAMAVLLTACGDDDPVQNIENATLTMSIQATMGAQGAVEMDSKTYSSPAVAEGFRMTRMSYYLSNIQLIESEDGVDLATDIAEVAYVNFGPNGTAEVQFQNVPAGDYDQLNFRLGLTAEQDETVPSDYANTNPLGRDSEYWFDWGSYIFMKAEGRSDTLADNAERFDVPFVYHIGRSANMGRDISLDYSLAIDQPEVEVQLNFNVAEVLGLGLADGVRLAGGIDHANMEAMPIMNRAAGAFSKSE